MSDLKDTVDRYLSVWNEPDAAARREAVAKLFAPDATYVDPLVAVQGHDQIEMLITGAREQFPGFVFSLLGETDTHHNVARFQWGLAPEGADEPLVIGSDVAVAGDDGMFSTVVGFLDKLPGA